MKGKYTVIFNQIRDYYNLSYTVTISSVGDTNRKDRYCIHKIQQMQFTLLGRVKVKERFLEMGKVQLQW